MLWKMPGGTGWFRYFAWLPKGPGAAVAPPPMRAARPPGPPPGLHRAAVPPGPPRAAPPPFRREQAAAGLKGRLASLRRGFPFRFTIRSKLVGIISLILIAAAGAIIVFATNLFSRDNVARVQEGNLETARLLASEVRTNLLNLTEKMRLLGINLIQPMSPEQREALQRPFFDQEKDLIAETVVGKTASGIRSYGRATNVRVMEELHLVAEDVAALHSAVPARQLLSGTETIRTDRLKGDVPVVTISIPVLSDDAGNVTHAAVATLKQDRFLKAVSGDSIITSYLVDPKGYLLAHPDQSRVLANENLAHLEIVRQLLSGTTNNGQTRFLDPATGAPFLGAFRTVGFGGIGVVSQVEEAKALEAAEKVARTSAIITGMVIVLAFLIVFFFSLSLTKPLLSLVDASDLVAEGHYDVQVRRGANDEIGDLTSAFNHMTMGLKEREKMKAAFSKFHSKEMTDLVLRGELKLGGERKSAVVFFSDVRGFTAMSEKLDPEALVKILNRYMTRMVSVIMRHDGIVDKYVGDAIMAVWGVPLSKGNDAERAIQACLGMRMALAELNEELGAEGLPTLRIGMGLNAGPLVSGNIGSEERMEFTVIGDTVNTASRIESLTKEFGTDLLVSQAVLDQTPGKFIAEKTHVAMVKGKSEPLVIYRVLGTVDANGKENRIETAYSSYAAEKSDKVVHASPAAAPPVMEAPVMETPVMEAPVMEAPVMEAPVMEAPVMELAPAEPPPPAPAGEELFPEEHTAALSIVDISTEDPPKNDEAA